MDGDGDWTSSPPPGYDDEIAWYENTDGAGTFGSPAGRSPRRRTRPGSVFAADLDGDGDLDVLSASQLDDKIAWYENRGGQFALATTDTAPAALLQGDTSDLLEIVMTHRGRAGDSDEELATLELLFEETPGDPLSSAEAGALIDTLAVYRDTGSGLFEAGSDTLVGSVGTLSLAAGIQTLTLPDGHAGAQVVFGTPGTFFVVVTLTSDANSQTPHRFQVTHVTESSSTAEDRATDTPLLLEYAADVSSRIVLAASPTSDEDGDGLFDIVETDTGVYVSPTDTGTDPFDSDSDDDGFNDGWEVDAGTDPNDPNEHSRPSGPRARPLGPGAAAPRARGQRRPRAEAAAPAGLRRGGRLRRRVERAPSDRMGVVKRSLPTLVLLALVTLAVYGQVLGHDFLHYDDPIYVTDNPTVQEGLGWQGIRWAFTTTHRSNWFPLTWLSHMLDCQLFGLNPAGHHFTNLLLHVLNTLLLFALLRAHDGGAAAQRAGGRALRHPPASRRIRGLGGGAQGRAEHLLRVSRDLVLRGLRAAGEEAGGPDAGITASPCSSSPWA